MTNINDIQTNPKKIKGMPPIMRAIEMAEVSLVVSNSGRVAVADQVALEEYIDVVATMPEQDVDYQGIVEIDHEAANSNQEITNDTENVPSNDNTTEVVKHSYLGESLISPTENNPYPDKSPLLGSN